MRYRSDDGTTHTGTWARVLVAAGRRPVLDGLGLAHAGVAFDKHGRPHGFDEQTLRIAETPVFLAGDVSGLRPLLHEASVHVPAPPRGPRWTVHGSSITQCNEAESPLGTWPALVAAQNDYELKALGLSGQCHLDPPVAETIGTMICSLRETVARSAAVIGGSGAVTSAVVWSLAVCATR